MKRYLLGLAVLIALTGGIIYFYSITPANSGGVTAPQATSTNPNGPKTYTLADIASHNSPSDCWTTIDGKVYNITSFIPNHPGGSIIIRVCGRDGTALFNNVPIHENQNARAILNQYYIGDLKI